MMGTTDSGNGGALPEGIFSILDTDLYKLTMQCAVLQHYPNIDVTYRFTNRTPDLKLNREAFNWLKEQVGKLANISLTDSELSFLKEKCPYLTSEYLDYLKQFRFRPDEQLVLSFDGGNDPKDQGEVNIDVKGTWLETILYEIPLLVLVSETFFRFVDTEWTYDGQEEFAYNKGKTLLEAGAVFSEFGTRRRRSYHTQDIVMRGLIRAAKDHSGSASGTLNGTSNVHFAHRYGLNPVGTVAHEWYMGIAAINDDYVTANELGLVKWTETFGPGVLAIALTDTFGTKQFLRDFEKPCELKGAEGKTYAEVYTGVRQDSGDPEEFVMWMRDFYDKLNITEKKTIVFSDSLNIDLVLQFKKVAEAKGFGTSFGIGTFLTNDFRKDDGSGEKSTPLNIVIKLSSANGNQAVKISDNIGKNTGDEETVKKVKETLGYTESGKVVDEAKRW